MKRINLSASHLSWASVVTLSIVLASGVVRAQGITDHLGAGRSSACVDMTSPFDEDGRPIDRDEDPLGECDDWDVLLGLQCDNDFPPGEIEVEPEPEDTAPNPEDDVDDTGALPPTDTGAEFEIDEICDDCEAYPLPGGGLWIDEDGEGLPGDSGAPPASLSAEAALAASLFDQLHLGGTFLITSRYVRGYVEEVVRYKLISRRLLKRGPGLRSAELVVKRLFGSLPTHDRYLVTIDQCSMTAQALP